MGTLTTRESAVFWRSVDAPHAGYEDVPSGSSIVAGPFPRTYPMACHGNVWPNAEEYAAHAACVHG